MSFRITLCALCTALTTVSGPVRRPLPTVQPNPNTSRAGLLRDSVLTVTLDAQESLWWINGPDRPPMTIEAFGEPGEAPLMPGPLVRASVGTSLRLEIHNSLAKPLTLLVPAAVHGGPEGPVDSMAVPPGATRVFTTTARTAGNYVYRAFVPRNRATRLIAGLLSGALVIDTAGAPVAAHDRVFVVMQRPDSVSLACADTATGSLTPCEEGRLSYTINGRSWPNTERIHAVVGDTLHWRVINASNDVHPMHLHGFYYRVDALSAPLVGIQSRPFPGQLVATQVLTGFSGMTMTWSPDRPGNWLFHCHFAMHLMADGVPLTGADLAMRDMSGLVLGAIVSGRRGVRAAGEPAAMRHLRLIATEDSATHGATGPIAVPAMRFLLEEGGRRVDAGPDFSPEMDLTRDEPVAITIVNHLREPTSVHWHGIELEDSYVDGVPGFSGSGAHVAPAIAPGDSFVARFTPPRSGTFMYHAHFDERWEQLAGLEGALIVRDPGTRPAADDHVLFLKTSRFDAGEATPLEINGRVHPDTLVLHVGRPARLRLINLSTFHSSAAPMIRLVRLPDTVDRWRPVAKDGAELPEDARAPRAASQVVGMGETYDFEYTPESRVPMRLEVLSTAFSPRTGGALLLTVAIRVE